MTSDPSAPAQDALPTATGPFARLVDRVLSEEVIRTRSPSTVRRLRMAVSSALSLLIITVTLALPVIYVVEGFSTTFMVLGLGAVLSPLLLLLPRWTKSETLPGLVCSLQSVGMIIGMSLGGGPVGQVAIYWHVTAPLTAGLLAGAWPAVICGTVSVAHLSVLSMKTAQLAPFSDNPALWAQLSLLVLVFFTASLAWFYETARARDEQEKEKSHRDEKMRLEKELEIASRIQSSILPGKVEIPGLEISARMVPASEVGGDYYDVLPVKGGCWIGIGDVSGHGLDAGLIMMMLQSTIASLSRYTPDASPRELLNLSNQVLFHNIRSRLKRDDYITLALMRYAEDGQVVVAGAHEDVLIYRTAERRCQRLETHGAWIGAMHNVERFTIDTRFTLEPGDVMLMYTDGITEAMNAEGKLFGIDRLIAEFEQAAHLPADAIIERLMGRVRSWSQKPQDDITLMALRHQGIEDLLMKRPA
ncbi:MAG TPA: PP2C family protein-serine/threonine phosphatase [Myxococcaceae bacterium]|nr:PP2C family protein-serine/threonine phosphatase [Myxococcaceae bacterium]